MKKKLSRMKILLAVLGVALVAFVTGLNSLNARAAEDNLAQDSEENDVSTSESTADVSELSQLMTANEAVDMKAKPDEDSETIQSYQEGDSVFVTGKTSDGWYRTAYRGKEGYIPEKALSMQQLDVEGLDAELDETKREAELVVETVEKYHEETRRSNIWGIVIGVLVVGIFATGIISGIRNNKTKK